MSCSSRIAHACLWAVLLCAPLFANDTPPASPPRYTFSWPLDGGGLMPRGGTTKGPAVTLDQAANRRRGKRLQEKGLSDARARPPRDSRDGRHVSRDVRFPGSHAVRRAGQTEGAVPVVGHGEGLRRQRHRASSSASCTFSRCASCSRTARSASRWSRSTGGRTGPTSRRHIVEYKGKRSLGAPPARSDAGGRGAWLQTVYQVDESPRYASLGQLAAHRQLFELAERRDVASAAAARVERARRLPGAGRHESPHDLADRLGSGREQPQGSRDAARELDSSRPYVAREYGVARYERIRDADFAAADRYYERTQRVLGPGARSLDARCSQSAAASRCSGPVDKLGLFQPLFAHAEAIAEQGAPASKKNADVIESALKAMGACVRVEAKTGGNSAVRQLALCGAESYQVFPGTSHACQHARVARGCWNMPWRP